MTSRRTLFLIVILALSAHAARAQQRDSVAALKRLTLDQLMNIEVVSVAGRPERLCETASAIHVITQDDIRAADASCLAWGPPATAAGSARTPSIGCTARPSVAIPHCSPMDKTPPTPGIWARVGFVWTGMRRPATVSVCRAIGTMAGSPNRAL